MTRTRLVWAALALWLVCFGMGFVAFSRTEPTGDSFLRGANRLGVFLLWQLAGTVPAIIAFVAARALPPCWARRLSWGPVSLYGSVVMAVLGLALWSQLQSRMHPPHAPPGPEAADAVTLPAD